MNDGSGLKYLLTDHLGSTSAVVDANGSLLSQQRYLPFGEVRTIPNSPIIQTDLGYTGQRNLSGTGLMDYRARFYDPALGRFIQSDSIVANPLNPQSFNRYSYVLNRPIRYNDPSGYTSVCAFDNADPECNSPDPWQPTLANYGVTLNNASNYDYKQIKEEVERMASILNSLACYVEGDECSILPDHLAFQNIVGKTTINFYSNTKETKDVCFAHTGTINCYGMSNRLHTEFRGLITHEFGHILNNLSGQGPDDGSVYTETNVEVAIEGATIFTASGLYVTGYIDGGYNRTRTGYGHIMHDIDWLPGGARGYEEFSDMWLNYVYDSFSQDEYGYGDARYHWMQTFMPLVVSWIIH
jgi:RHS repeat-associated protein